MRQRHVYPGTLNWSQLRLSAFLDRLLDGGTEDDQLADGMRNTALLLALHQAVGQRQPVRVADMTTGLEAHR
ncbi:MAG TPA: hypothetical protein VGM53_23125 [Streptosporangiaceae bacterium]|jgi:hypothetical protein